MKKPYKAILFDLDGVLINSMPLHVLAFNRCLDLFGIEVREESIAGRRTSDVMESLLEGKCTSTKIRDLCEAKSNLARELISDAGVDLVHPQAWKVLPELAKFFSLGLCTSGGQANATSFLKLAPFAEIFQVVLTSSEVVSAKPHPEIYELAAKKLNTSTSDCVVVEDSISGVISGYSAGCLVGVVPGSGRSLCGILPKVLEIVDLGSIPSFLELY